MCVCGPGQIRWLPDPTPNRYGGGGQKKQKKKKKDKGKAQGAQRSYMRGGYDGAGGTMPGGWFAWA